MRGDSVGSLVASWVLPALLCHCSQAKPVHPTAWHLPVGMEVPSPSPASCEMMLLPQKGRNQGSCSGVAWGFLRDLGPA